ncbi:MAG: polyprenyl diphosphate synthase [Pseudomonadota bacterium]
MATKESIAATPGDSPRHVAIIMDGNGRWARQRGKLRHLGHRAGIKPVRDTVRYAAERGVQYLTLFAFSSENFRRPREEVSALMRLFIEALDREVKELHENDVRLRFVGELSRLSGLLRQKMHEAEALTANNQGLRLSIAAAYGGRWDIANAARLALEAGLAPEEISEESLAPFLQLGDYPAPDLLIRTGGELRVSNFLLWQLAYSELYFTETLWPDFTVDAFEAALEAYSGRQRRHGRTSEQVRKA